MDVNISPNKHFNDFKEAIRFLYFHPVFRDADGDSMFDFCLDKDHEWFDPATGEVGFDQNIHTEFRIRLACSPWETSLSFEERARASVERCLKSDVVEFACTAPTYEEAIIDLANVIYNIYGDEKSFS